MLNFQRHTSYFLLLTSYFFFASCSIQKKIAKSAQEDVLSNKALTAAHVGISIFDPAADKYLYNYQGDKYFVPASNTKLPTCYAAMKYLGDSLVGLKYFKSDDVYLFPTGDPTFFHPDFRNQPVYQFLSRIKHATITANNWDEEGLGKGWTWNDYNESYQSERSAFPINGNCITFFIHRFRLGLNPFKIDIEDTGFMSKNNINFYVRRYKDDNRFILEPAKTKFSSQSVPFIPNDTMLLNILRDNFRNLQLNDNIPIIGTTIYDHSMSILFPTLPHPNYRR